MSTCMKALCRHVKQNKSQGVGGGREGGKRGREGARGGRGGERGVQTSGFGGSKRGVARFTECHRKWKEMKTELAHLISAPYAS